MDAARQHVRARQGEGKHAGNQREHKHDRAPGVQPKHEHPPRDERQRDDERNGQPMDASTEPSRMFTERWRRLACAARMAAMDSGVSTSTAMMKPPRATGAPSLSTMASIGTAIRFASSTSGKL